MANGPNTAFRNARARVGFSAEHVAAVEAARDERMANDPKREIMDKVARGEMSVDEGVAAMRAMMD